MSAQPSTASIASGPIPILCVGIGKRYSGENVLRGIDLQIGRGEVLGLIGRNRAGKSTLIRLILGLEEPDEGRARVFDEPSLALSDASKGRLGYVPQQPDTLA